MSGRVLRIAVRDAIKKRLSLKSEEIGLESGPKPPPSSGQIFISVHPGRWNELSSFEGDYSDHNHGVKVTTSVRSAHVPMDRWGKEVINTTADGLEKWAEEILAAVHNSWELINDANAILESATDEFGEVLRFIQAEEPQERNADWWEAGMEHQYYQSKQPHKSRAAGFSQTLVFDGARRTRFTDEQGWP